MESWLVWTLDFFLSRTNFQSVPLPEITISILLRGSNRCLALECRVILHCLKGVSGVVQLQTFHPIISRDKNSLPNLKNLSLQRQLCLILLSIGI